MNELVSIDELAACAIEPNWAYDDPEHRRWLAVDLSACPHLGPTAAKRLTVWLAQQPVPTIGVAADAQAPLADTVDLMVENRAQLEAVTAQIERFPNASSMLVQVLRVSTRLNWLEALTVESMAYATLQGGAEFAAWLQEQPARLSRARPRQDVVLLQRHAERLQVVLNSPENRNALSVAMRDALANAFRLAVQDTSVTHIEVSANGPCFCAGGDLTEFGTATDLAQAHRIRMNRMPARYLAVCRERCTFLVQGACIGAGIELSAFARRLVARPNATFHLPEVGMGLIPGAGGCVSIARRTGRQRTARMAILGETLNAHQALECGLIDAIEAVDG